MPRNSFLLWCFRSAGGSAVKFRGQVVSGSKPFTRSSFQGMSICFFEKSSERKCSEETKKLGSFSLIERLILSAGTCTVTNQFSETISFTGMISHQWNWIDFFWYQDIHSFRLPGEWSRVYPAFCPVTTVTLVNGTAPAAHNLHSTSLNTTQHTSILADAMRTPPRKSFSRSVTAAPILRPHSSNVISHHSHR